MIDYEIIYESSTSLNIFYRINEQVMFKKTSYTNFEQLSLHRQLLYRTLH